MPTIEERVAYLEGRMQDHSALWTELRSGVNDLRVDMNRRFEEVRLEVADVRADMNRRFEDVRTEFADVRSDMSRRFGEVRAEIGQVRVDLHRLDDKVDRHFLWLAGTLVTSVLVMMGGIVGLYFK